jgi:hypothetical protein
VGERYVLLERIGRGGMGTVHRALDDQLGREVALKLLRADLLTESNALDRFRREAQAAANMDSPHVVKIIDFGVEPDGQAYVAMELLQGQTLRSLLARGPLKPGRVVQLARQVLLALEEAHGHGVVHRDIKPENIFICQGDPGEVKVLDFGLAKMVGPVSWTDAGGITESGVLLGTPHYMAPEQAGDEGEVGAHADLYSLGVVMYEALTGERPFRASSALAILLMHKSQAPLPPRKRRPELDIPRALESVVLRAMGKQPKERFDSAAAMRAELASLEVGEQPSRTADRARPALPWILMALALLALTAGLMVVSWGTDPPRPDPQTVVLPAGADAASAAAPVKPDVAPAGPSAAVRRPDAGERITLVIQPSVPSARVMVDGKHAGTGVVRLELPRATTPIRLEIRAARHLPHHRVIVPDRDRTLSVKLEPFFRSKKRLGLERNPYGK